METKPSLKPFKKHIFVCTGPRCAPEESPKLYQHLKDELKKQNLSEGKDRIHRSQSHCFGICQGGPIAVVYPENVWYHHLNPSKVDRIIREHLVEGKPVEEFCFYPDS